MLFEPGSIADCINEHLERIRYKRLMYQAYTDDNWRRVRLNYLYAIVNAINWANSPSRAMTEREHKACSHLSRYCRKRLQEFIPFGTTESGLYYVK